MCSPSVTGELFKEIPSKMSQVTRYHMPKYEKSPKDSDLLMSLHEWREEECHHTWKKTLDLVRSCSFLSDTLIQQIGDLAHYNFVTLASVLVEVVDWVFVS